MRVKSRIYRNEECGVVAIVRFNRLEDLVNIALAIAKGGVHAIEFTMTTPNALDILAKAQLIVAPTLRKEVIEMCRRDSVAVFPGAYTPTKILTACEWGADIVILFPADAGGLVYLIAMKAPLPQVKLVPTGGVSLENAGEYIKAGASAIAVGSS